MTAKFDVVIIGGGPVGLAAALGFTRRGRSVALVTGGRAPPDDGRSAAILRPGLDLLKRLGAGKALEAGHPLVGIRIVDATDSLFRSPPVTFRAAELDLPNFGLNVAITDLVRTLEEAAADADVDVYETEATRVGLGEARATVSLNTGEAIAGMLVVGADGQNSLVREAAGIVPKRWSYPQTALTFRVRHDRAHDDISTEFHTREGPMTFVPRAPGLSNVVWMMAPARADLLVAAGPDAIADAATRESRRLLGHLSAEGAVGRYPMSGLSTPRAGQRRAALVGEALHLFPPIGAQGLNLGLRDVEALLEATGATVDPGADAVLDAYTDARRLDLTMRTAAVDVMNRVLITGGLAPDLLRGAALSLLGGVGPVRRLLMRWGLGGGLSQTLSGPGARRDPAEASARRSR